MVLTDASARRNHEGGRINAKITTPEGRGCRRNWKAGWDIQAAQWFDADEQVWNNSWKTMPATAGIRAYIFPGSFNDRMARLAQMSHCSQNPLDLRPDAGMDDDKCVVALADVIFSSHQYEEVTRPYLK